jgi:integrase
MQGEELEPPRMLSEQWDYYFSYITGLLGKDYTKATLQKYRTAYKHLKKFMKIRSGADDMRLDELDHKFIKDYNYYLKTSCNLQNNSAIQMIKRLRTIIRVAMDFGWVLRDPFIAHRMKADEVHRSYLSGEELSRMAVHNLQSKRLEIVRDLFLFSCYTGLSFSDTVKLTGSDIITEEDGEQWLQTHRIKNNNRVRVPLLPPAIAILAHYKEHPKTPAGKLLPLITNQRANSYLKEIAKSVGITKHLTYHCSRHTFATTVTLTNGVPIETVGQMLGHKSIRTTQHYARVTDTKIHIDMLPLKKRYRGQKLYLEKNI